MKKSVIKSAKTVEEAVRLALLELNTTEDKVEVNIIEQPSSGFLGIIGVKPAIIKVVEKDASEISYKKEKYTEAKSKANQQMTVNDNEEVDITEFVQKICDNIISGCQVSKKAENEEGLEITISGDNIGLIVGKHGETLNSLQYLTAMVYSKQKGSYKRVSIDAGGYRERREKKIIQFGTRMAEKACRTGRRISLEPMNSYERRIVHMALQDVDGINTFSEGDEPNRRVVITPINERNGNNRYNRSSKPYRTNNSRARDHAKEERNYKAMEKKHNQIANEPKKPPKKSPAKQREGNPYEHYYSKYDNRYKK